MGSKNEFVKNFNYDEFVRNYQLTEKEYSLMDFPSRMIYADRLYESEIKNNKAINSSKYITFPECFKEYFVWKGYQVIGFSDENSYIIKKVREGGYVESSFTNDDIVKLDSHINRIAMSKATLINYRVSNNVDAIMAEEENFYSILTYKERLMYVNNMYSKTIKFLLPSIGDSYLLDKVVPLCYKDYFSYCGVKIEHVIHNGKLYTKLKRIEKGKEVPYNSGAVKDLSSFLPTREIISYDMEIRPITESNLFDFEDLSADELFLKNLINQTEFLYLLQVECEMNPDQIQCIINDVISKYIELANDSARNTEVKSLTYSE